MAPPPPHQPPHPQFWHPRRFDLPWHPPHPPMGREAEEMTRTYFPNRSLRSLTERAKANVFNFPTRKHTFHKPSFILSWTSQSLSRKLLCAFCVCRHCTLSFAREERAFIMSGDTCFVRSWPFYLSVLLLGPLSLSPSFHVFLRSVRRRRRRNIGRRGERGGARLATQRGGGGGAFAACSDSAEEEEVGTEYGPTTHSHPEEEEEEEGACVTDRGSFCLVLVRVCVCVAGARFPQRGRPLPPSWSWCWRRRSNARGGKSCGFSRRNHVHLAKFELLFCKETKVSGETMQK